jgi:hypothetical protein
MEGNGLKDRPAADNGQRRQWRKYARVDMVNVCTGLRSGKVNYWGGDGVVTVNFRDGFLGDKSLMYSTFDQ